MGEYTDRIRSRLSDMRGKNATEVVARASTSPHRAQQATSAAPFWATSQADVERAVKAERTRVAAVFGSPDSRGRELVCATLLTDERAWSAARICAELEHLPTDAELARQSTGKTAGNSRAVWAAALANLK